VGPHKKSRKYTRMSASSTKSLLFGVFASAMIASFALASENAHVLLHQVRAFRFVSFLSSSSLQKFNKDGENWIRFCSLRAISLEFFRVSLLSLLFCAGGFTFKR
jgi:hypothetical protein